MKFDLAKYSNPVFVETGTYKGEGIAKALAAGFEKIYSIEIAQEFYDKALEKFKTEIDSGRVEIVLGDSLSCLPDIINKIDKNITFWLDAHTQEGHQGEKPCPLYEELDAIANHSIKTHTLLIDDLRFWETKGWGKTVRLNVILEKIKQINGDYDITYEDGKVENDVLVAVLDGFQSNYKVSGYHSSSKTTKKKGVFHSSNPLDLVKILRLPQPKGIIHVGANVGQEVSIYKQTQAVACVYIEPIPTIFEQLKNHIGNTPNHYPIQALCSDIEGVEVTFNVSSGNGQASTMFPLGKHEKLYPNVKYIDSLKIKTITLDKIIEQNFIQHNFELLVLDTQGAELKVLKGSDKLLENQIRYIYTEISEEPLYEGGCTFEEITEFLKPYGFKLKNMFLNFKQWGNAFYVKDSVAEIDETVTPNLALNKPTEQSSYNLSNLNKLQSPVNGIKNGKFSFHTKKEVNPWWQVDLEDIYALTEVRVYNRIDTCSDRARTLRILISSDGENWEQVYANDESYIFGGIDGRPLVVPISSKVARYVRLQLNEENHLHLDEVEVYGAVISA